MSKRPMGPVLFIIAGGLFLAAAIRDMFFPTLLSSGHHQPTLSAAVGTVFLIIGIAQRRRFKA